MPAGQRVSRVLLALLAGLVVGIVAGAYQNQTALDALSAIAPIGTLWINAVRMTVVPLVIALLFTSLVGTERTSVIGRETAGGAATFVGLLLFAAFVAWLLAPGLIEDIAVTPETSAALRASVASTATETRQQIDRLPGFRDWLLALVPSNAVRAAADGAMLPLIVFTALFAIAARQIAAGQRASLVAFFAALADAMKIVVEWTIMVAPIGVFALIAAPAAASGASIAGAIGHYIVSISAICILFTLLLYPVAHFSGVHLVPFSRAAMPAQATALASSSSLASLPALMRGADEIGVPRQTSGFVLPLAVGTFKVAAPITWTMGTLFIARLYGVTLDPAAVFWVALTAIGMSFSIPGVPQGSLLLLSAVMVNVGVPAEGVALLIAIDTIPDLVATMTNVTGDLVATVVVTRFGPVHPEESDGAVAGDLPPEPAPDPSLHSG
jgi:proton glutamate symport protein